MSGSEMGAWRGPLRVNVYEKNQLDYWIGRFGCTREELRETVIAVGVSADAVTRAMTSRSGKARSTTTS